MSSGSPGPNRALPTWRTAARAVALAMLTSLSCLVPVDGAAAQFEWTPLFEIPGAVDIAGPRQDGRFVVSSDAGGLLTLRPGSPPQPYGERGYEPSDLGEPYLALSRGGAVRGAGCEWGRDDAYVLDPSGHPRVVEVTEAGRARTFARLPREAFPSGITFDQVGRFGGRLLVIGRFGDPSVDPSQPTSTLYGIDCEGDVRTYVEGAPDTEGGIAVAPRSFEPYGGRVVAVDEFSSEVHVFGANGSARVIARVPSPAGAEVGLESVGFVPRRFGPGEAAYVAERPFPPPSPPTGTILTARRAALLGAGVGARDLIAATEGGLETFEFECSLTGCASTFVGTGPETAHGEGHIAFGPAP